MPARLWVATSWTRLSPILYFSLLSNFSAINKYHSTAPKVGGAKEDIFKVVCFNQKYVLKVSHCLQKAPSKMQIYC